MSMLTKPKVHVQRQRLIFDVQIPAKPRTTAEMPTLKAMTATRLLIASKFSLVRLASDAGEMLVGVRLVVRYSSDVLS